jgi:hypothetical protein
MKNKVLQHTSAALAFSFAAWAGAAAPVTAADSQPKTQPAGDALVITSGGLDAVFADPKDATLLRALHMLDDRIKDLPAEFGDDDFPAAGITLVLDMLKSPMSMRLGLLEGASLQSDVPPIYAQFDIHANDAAGASMFERRLREVMVDAGMQREPHAQRDDNLTAIDLDGVPVTFGATTQGDAPVFSIGANRLSRDPVTIGSTGLPAGVTPAVTVRFDSASLVPLVREATQRMKNDPNAAMVLQQLNTMGLMSENPPVVTIAYGHATDRAHLNMRWENLAPAIARTGVTRELALKKADFRPVPKSALFASVGKVDFETYIDTTMESMRPLIEQGMDIDMDQHDPFDLIAQKTGIHLRHDLLANLGRTIGCYSSDETGGGLLGAVMFMEVTNPDGMQETIDKIAGMANAITAREANGYVRISSMSLADSRVSVLTFPGLPMPLEISCGQAGGYFLAALSPQALLAGIEQVKNPTSTLLENPRFVDMGGTLDNAVKAQFVDTPRTLHDGYTLVSLGTSALSNMMRSPRDTQREPGFIMPPFPVLAENVKATVTMTRIDGDDLVIESQSDRSMLVNACGAIGVVGNSASMVGVVFAGGLGASLMLPALAKARKRASALASMENLQFIDVAYSTYAAEHDDRLPSSLEELRPYLGDQGVLASPHGPAWDGGPDYWLYFDDSSFSAIKWPAEQILGLDRAMLLKAAEEIPVLFADGHIALVSYEALSRLLTRPANAHLKMSDFE